MRMTVGFAGLALAGLAVLVPPPVHCAEIVGYYPGWKSAGFAPSAANIDARKLTVLMYAFLDTCRDGRHGNPDPATGGLAPCQDAAGAPAHPADGTLVLADAVKDGANLRALVALKQANPKLRVLLSVGGWNWSNQFSNLAAEPAARAAFVASTLALLRRFELDGVDIDWEYPGAVGVACTVGQVCERAADKQNYVTLARELRAAFDAAGRADGKRYLITIAAGANASFVADGPQGSAWIKALAASLDWINIMSYDFHMPWEKNSGHLAALDADPADPLKDGGLYGMASVRRYLAAGVAPQQLVLGLPFYGYGWKGCAPGAAGDGQYQVCAGAADGGNDGASSYSFGHLLQRGLLLADGQGRYTVGGKGYVRHWNAKAQAPYLHHAGSGNWISYEDEASLRAKAAYIRSAGLRGAMFWELSADGGQTLGGALAEALAR